MAVHVYWLALTIPAFLLGLWLLVRVATGLLRATRASVVAAAPLREVVPLQIAEPGDYALLVEGQRFTNDFGALDYSMRDGGASIVPLGGVFGRMVVSSVDRVRLQVRTFHLRSAGEVTLHVTGIRGDSDPGNRIVVARPMMGTLVTSVLALIGLGALTVASLGGSIAIVVLSQR